MMHAITVYKVFAAFLLYRNNGRYMMNNNTEAFNQNIKSNRKATENNLSSEDGKP